MVDVLQKFTGNGEANLAGLDADVRAAFGGLTSGVSVNGNDVIIHLADSATPAQIAQARQIVQNHNPARLTPAQQEAADRRALLTQLRASNTAPINPDSVPNTLEGIRQMARKLAWLEQEVLALQKGG